MTAGINITPQVASCGVNRLPLRPGDFYPCIEDIFIIYPARLAVKGRAGPVGPTAFLTLVLDEHIL